MGPGKLPEGLWRIMACRTSRSGPPGAVPMEARTATRARQPTNDDGSSASGANCCGKMLAAASNVETAGGTWRENGATPSNDGAFHASRAQARQTCPCVRNGFCWPCEGYATLLTTPSVAVVSPVERSRESVESIKHAPSAVYDKKDDTKASADKILGACGRCARELIAEARVRRTTSAEGAVAGRHRALRCNSKLSVARSCGSMRKAGGCQ